MSLLARERSDQRVVGRHVLGLVCLESTALRSILRALRHDQVWNGTLQVELGTRCRAIELCVCRVAGRDKHGRTQSFSVLARPARITPMLSRATQTPQQLSADPAQTADLLSTIARVASEMAHDFNNQLAVVLNYSFILLRELPSTSPMRTHVAELQGAAWRAAEVAREILRFGAKRSADATEIDLHQLLRAAQTILSSMLGGGQTRVELQLAAESCKVVARRAPLEWVLFELSARLQARLGRLAILRISTSTSMSQHFTNDAARDNRRVMITLDAHGMQSAPSQPTEPDPSGTQHGVRRLENARSERTLEHARGELSLHTLPDGGLRYLICLPAASG